jgi:hypothetical protein
MVIGHSKIRETMIENITGSQEEGKLRELGKGFQK